MELFFPEISTTTLLSRLRTRSGRKALGIELPPQSGHFDVGRESCGPMDFGLAAFDRELGLAIHASN